MNLIDQNTGVLLSIVMNSTQWLFKKNIAIVT